MKKTIGLIVAMDKELSLFIDNNPLVSIENKRGCFDFYITNVNDNVLVIAKSGIGKVNSALCVATMINECNVDRTLCSKCSSCEYTFTDKGLVRIYSKELQIFKIIQRDSIHCFRVF